MGTERSALRRTTTILALCSAMAAGATALLLPLLHADPPVAPAPFGFLVLAALFAAAETCVVHVHVRRHAHSFSMTEAPLILGLAFFAPVVVLAARLAGAATALVVVRRQQPIKLLFNLSLFALDTALIAAVVHGVGIDPLEPAGWAVVLAGTLLGMVVGCLTVGIAIAATEGAALGRLRDLVGGIGPLTTTLGTACGLIAAVVLRETPAAWVLLVGGAGVVAAAIRAHADLREHHQRLERAYEFTTDAIASLEVGEDRAALLGRACELLRAEWAELAVIGADDSQAMVLSNRSGEVEVVLGPDAAELVRASQLRLGDAASAIVHGSAADPFRRAVVAAIPGRSRNHGAFLVADRLGQVDRFGEGDRRLLETLAAQAAVVLRNRALLDRLRDEVADREHRSLHDSLTQLPNRVHLAAELERSLAERRADGVVAVLLVDLDRFKEVNDTLGHQQGDCLLQDVARRVRDAVPAAAVVCRLGGDEFAILLPDGVVDSVPAAEAVAERLLAALVAPFPLAGLLVDVGASVGIASCPHHAADPTTLLQRADVAMYAAKAVGTGVAVYDSSDDRTSRERLGLVAELRTAIERKELRVEFQPIVELRTGRAVGAEALCRWHHPVRGMVAPDLFVAVAEASGLIRPLTELVLAQALRHLRRWRDAGADIGVSVNLSTRNLLDDSLPSTIDRLLAQAGVPPPCLTLEVTESSIMAEPVRAIGIVNRLSSMGVRLSIDDFGTGYSSLSHLHRLPVDEVKIDRSFVRDLGHRREDLAIVKAIAELGRMLELEVTAEGVEDGQTLQLLAGLGCHHAQGYHVSRPLSPAVFDRWLRQNAEDEAALEQLFDAELPAS